MLPPTHLPSPPPCVGTVNGTIECQTLETANLTVLGDVTAKTMRCSRLSTTLISADVVETSVIRSPTNTITIDGNLVLDGSNAGLFLFTLKVPPPLPPPTHSHPTPHTAQPRRLCTATLSVVGHYAHSALLAPPRCHVLLGNGSDCGRRKAVAITLPR